MAVRRRSTVGVSHTSSSVDPGASTASTSRHTLDDALAAMNGASASPRTASSGDCGRQGTSSIISAAAAPWTADQTHPATRQGLGNGIRRRRWAPSRDARGEGKWETAAATAATAAASAAGTTLSARTDSPARGRAANVKANRCVAAARAHGRGEEVAEVRRWLRADRARERPTPPQATRDAQHAAPPRPGATPRTVRRTVGTVEQPHGATAVSLAGLPTRGLTKPRDGKKGF